MIKFALLCILSGCVVETFTDHDAGVVYECTGLFRPQEWCWLGDVEELERLTGATCEKSSRWWPIITNGFSNGCIYMCPAVGAGCNAFNGCFCPEE